MRRSRGEDGLVTLEVPRSLVLGKSEKRRNSEVRKEGRREFWEEEEGGCEGGEGLPFLRTKRELSADASTIAGNLHLACHARKTTQYALGRP